LNKRPVFSPSPLASFKTPAENVLGREELVVILEK